MRTENWIKWDLSSRDDPGTRYFLSKYKDKARAYGFFLWIIEKLYCTNDGWLEMEDPIFVEGFSEEIGWDPEEVLQAIAWLIQAKLFITKDGKFASKKGLREREHRELVSERRAEAGKKGGINSALSKQLLSKFKQSQADEMRGEEIRLEKEEEREALPRPQVSKKSLGPDPEKSPGEIKRWPGCKFIQTTAEEYNKLVKLFGHDLLKQEIPDADEWIAKSDKPSARKYRKPESNHYLFLRTTWLKGKFIRRDKNFQPIAQPKPNGPVSSIAQNLVSQAMPKLNRVLK